MTKNTRDTILDQYYDVRENSTKSLDIKKNQYFYDKIVHANYRPFFEEKHKSVLEIGCYFGYTIHSLKNLNVFDQISAVEISSSAAEMAKEYTGISEIYVEDAFHFLKNKKGNYDVIIMKAVLEHIEKERIGELIGLIYNSLKKGGICLISVPNMDWIGAMHERYMDFTHEIGFTQESLKDVLNISFQNVRVKTMKYDFVWNFASAIRIIFLKPIVKALIKYTFKILGQGVYRNTIFDRSILAIAKK